MATHSKQITYNPVLLAVTEMGGKSGASSQGRDVNPARALRKAPKERCTVIWAWKDCLQILARPSGRGGRWFILQDPII